MFRDMIKLGAHDSKPIQLCDPDFEKATILTEVLNIVIKNAPFLMTDGMLRKDILKFMQKYDFQRDLAHISKALKLEVGGAFPETIFISASHLGDWELCGSIIAGCHLAWMYTGDDMDDFGEALGECDVYDVRSWSLVAMQQLPPAVLWAWSRASMKGDGLETREERAKAIGEEFMRLMTLKGQCIVERKEIQ